MSASLIAIYSTQVLSGVSESRNRMEFGAVVKSAVKWALGVWAHRGLNAFISDVKAMSLYCRSQGVASEVEVPSYRNLVRRMGVSVGNRDPIQRSRAMQFARLARALPPPLSEAEAKALTEHRRNLCGQGVTPPAVLGELEAFGEWFAKRYSPGDPIPRPSVSGSACFEKSKAEGGQLAALAEWHENAVTVPRCRQIEDLSPGDRARAIGPPENELARTPAISCLQDIDRLATLVEEVDPSSKHPVRRAVVIEPGVKTRVVTAHPLREVVLGQYARQLAFGALGKFPPVRTVLSGQKLKSVREVVKGVFRDVDRVYSADLSNATDFVHQDAAASW